MPYLNIKFSGELPPSMVGQVACTLTELTARLLQKQSAVTAVVVEQVPATGWFIGGQTLAGSGRNSFCLDIKITEGTNTKQQKADYIREVFLALEKLLGDVDAASYIIIHDVKADAWGYQGTTQEYRFIDK